MKKIYDKIKLILATFRTTIISFSSKVFALVLEYDERKYPQTEYGISHVQTKYGVVNPIVDPYDGSTPTIIIIKIAQILLIVIIPIIGIVNLIKIRKIDDKAQKKKKIRITIIVIAILILILVAAFLIPTLLLTK